MADEWEDRVDTVSRALLGLTVACARCHDHKFDPITMRDYYALAGVFASTSMVNKTADGQPMKDGPKGDASRSRHAPHRRGCEAAGPQRLPPRQRREQGAGRRAALPRGAQPPSDATAFSDGSGRRELAERIASARQPAHRARLRQPRLGALLRPAARLHPEQLRPLRRPADAIPSCSTTSRGASWTSGWSVKAPRPRDRPLGHLSPGLRVRRRHARRRSRQPASFAHEPPAPHLRAVARLRPLRQRRARSSRPARSR